MKRSVMTPALNNAIKAFDEAYWNLKSQLEQLDADELDIPSNEVLIEHEPLIQPNESTEK